LKFVAKDLMIPTLPKPVIPCSPRSSPQILAALSPTMRGFFAPFFGPLAGGPGQGLSRARKIGLAHGSRIGGESEPHVADWFSCEYP
jgi:hypothetical protein